MKPNALHELGEEKLATIINRLVSGESTMSVARNMQEQWSEAQGCSRADLKNELRRLRLSIHRGGLSYESAKPSRSKTTDGLELAPLHQLASLIELQKRRVGELFKKEPEQGKYLPALTAAIKLYSKMLVSYQKMRFDLGLDVYKRKKVTHREWQAAQQAKKDEGYKYLAAAVKTVDDILKKNRPRLREIGRQEGLLASRPLDAE